jgi:hypothetical protein
MRLDRRCETRHGEAADRPEREAELAARQVMSGAAPLAQRPAAGLQRAGTPGSAPADVPPIVDEVPAEPGSVLDPRARAFMEARFGCDFGHVRVHQGKKAADSARAVNAQAYTVGSDVVFGPGRYAPGTEHGRHLLAHELAHVVQQSGSLSRKPVDDAAAATSGSTPKAASAPERVVRLAGRLAAYANQADTRLAASACNAALSGFTPARLRLASQSLVPVPALAAKSRAIGAPGGAAEAEADRVADTVMNNERISAWPGPVPLQLQRLLDTRALQQMEQNMPAITAASGIALEGAAVIAGGGGPPGWVAGAVIVAVVAVLAVGGYFYYRSQQTAPAPQPQPTPKMTAEERKRRRADCFERNPGAIACDEPVQVGGRRPRRDRCRLFRRRGLAGCGLQLLAVRPANQRRQDRRLQRGACDCVPLQAQGFRVDRIDIRLSLLRRRGQFALSMEQAPLVGQSEQAGLTGVRGDADFS